MNVPKAAACFALRVAFEIEGCFGTRLAHQADDEPSAAAESWLGGVPSTCVVNAVATVAHSPQNSDPAQAKPGALV